MPKIYCRDCQRKREADIKVDESGIVPICPDGHTLQCLDKKEAKWYSKFKSELAKAVEKERRNQIV